jgi:hypothetical protein
MELMSEAPESEPEASGRPAPAKPSKLYQAAAWVGIITGIVFSTAVVFFSGFAISHYDEWRSHHHRHHHGPCMHPGQPMPPGPGNGPGGPGGPAAPPAPRHP